MEKPKLQHIACDEGKVGGPEESPIIALIDQRALVRELVGSFLRERMPDFVVHQAASLAEIESRRSFAYRIFVIFQPAAAAEVAKSYIQVARLRQVFPSAPVIVVSTMGIASAIMTEASLSFLGFGVKVPTASWGSMINESLGFFSTAPLIPMIPGLAIAITVFAFNLFGDGVRDALDPRLK